MFDREQTNTGEDDNTCCEQYSTIHGRILTEQDDTGKVTKEKTVLAPLDLQFIRNWPDCLDVARISRNTRGPGG